MTQVNTNLRNSRELAKYERYQPVAAITSTNVQDAISELAGITQAVPTPLPVGSSPYQVQATDQILLVDTSGGPVTILMLPQSQRNNRSLEIKDVTGNAQANPISVTPSGGETIDTNFTNGNPYPMDSAFVDVIFKPKTGGYYVAS